jgi:hypothetical protein
VHRRLVTVAALAAGLLAAGSANAQGPDWADKTGQFGIGYDQTLGGIGGLSARYQVASNFGLQGIFGFDTVSLETGAGDVSETRIELGLRGVFVLAQTSNTNLGIIFGVDILNQSAEAGGVDNSSTDVALEGGLAVQYFLHEMFSINGEGGLVIFTGDGTSTVIGGPPMDVGVARPDLFGSAGFTFWFK